MNAAPFSELVCFLADDLRTSFGLLRASSVKFGLHVASPMSRRNVDDATASVPTQLLSVVYGRTTPTPDVIVYIGGGRLAAK
ncbi:hypothetical protein LSTR_LSTR007744 [Laodelphax striatellus]|uniref:Uncharacterized protein n=1 Tax=Laodelphax striatellus TaxID=195883 RepID=A0A482WKE6_LAOST|nr:hypothetical protein LSTR_LSTR007744 [Laodelphax striatellus]